MKQLFSFVSALCAFLMFSGRACGQSGAIHTIAGSATHYFAGDGGPATAAYLNGPFGVATDRRGNVFIADYDNNVIRKINAGGTITTIAGNTSYGDTGDGGPATAAKLAAPHGMAADSLGNLYIADYYNNLVRKVNTGDTISTFAGTHSSYGYSGDAGAATSALCWNPIAIIADNAGNVYFSDWSNNVVRKVNASGIITTIAGTGTAGYNGDTIAATSAKLNQPIGLAFDAAGNLLIADCNNNRIRRVNSSGVITTIAGTGTAGFSGDGGPATAAKFNGVFSVALDRDGNMYVVDGLNSRIRKIDTGRVVSTFAGGSTAGFSGDGGAATAASLSYPTGIATDTAGNVYIADLGNNRVRKVDCILPRITPIISSVTSLCEASVTTFLDSTLGGVWTTTNGHAYVSGGLVQGVSQGVDTVIYTVANHCGAVSVSRAITINPLPHAGPVLGSALICGVGDTTQLSDTVSGGTWLLTNTNATITTGGLVTGNRLGADTVRYIVTNGCGRDTAWGIITISPLPDAGVITGIPSICGVGNATNLADTAAGGAWTNVAPTVATVSGGTVWGINYGTDTIKYTVGNACGLATVGVPITVYHTYVSAIWGADTVCAGYHTSLYDSIAGGSWRSALGRTVVAATGVVTGVSVGIDTIHYTLTNPCGVYDTFFVVQVRPAENCWPLHTSTLSGAITSFGVIPNPSDGNIRLQIPMPDQEQANLTITDLLGRTVFRGAVRNGAEINTSILAGTYVLMVSTPTGTYVERIVIR